VPLFASEYWFSAILIPFLIFALAALGLNILTGYAGQLSLGSAAFMAVGAYAAYNFQLRIEGIPILVSFICGGLTAAAWACCSACRAAHQGLLPGGGDAGGAVLHRLVPDQVPWLSNNSSSGVISTS
jgi:branched-chain amino acid transport system permease protein